MPTYRYNTTNIVRNNENKRTQSTSLPYKPDKSVQDIYIYTRQGDRLDLLANEYYGDRTAWIYIAAANDLKEMVVEPGIQLRIPQGLNELRQQWTEFNQDR